MSRHGDAPGDVIVVGGGPAGMMAGLLLARAGVPVTVLEKHADFLRDFRGDTVHPSTLELFHQFGWLEELLQIEHGRVDTLTVRVAGRDTKVVELGKLPVAANFIAMMPQWDLLDFMAGKARRYPGFTLRMEAEAKELRFDAADRVDGVVLSDGTVLPSRLVLACDGRRSVLRERADLPLKTIGAPMDVFWFRLDKPAGMPMDGDTFAALEAGRFLIFIDRRSYFQCAFVHLKGQAKEVRARGLGAFCQSIAKAAPQLAAAAEGITDWDQIKLLDVALDRLERWHRPGLLAIGDAAHAMSPIGGVGINVAVQDAVMAANLLADPLWRGENPDPLLELVQQRRWRAVTWMQTLQKVAQDRFVEPVLKRDRPFTKPPLPMRILDAVPPLRRIPGRVIGLGFDPVRIESPERL